MSRFLLDPETGLLLPRRRGDVEVPARLVHPQMFACATGVFDNKAPLVSDPYWGSVALLCHMNGANNSTLAVDSTSYARTINCSSGTGGASTISTAQKKFGTASFALASGTSGGGATYSGNPSASLSFGTGDFTLEGWLYLASITATFPALYQTDGGHTGRFYFGKYPGANQLYVQAPSGSDIGPFTADFVATTWTHVAWSRISGVSQIYVDGTRKYNAADTNNYQAGTTGFYLGAQLGTLGADFLDDLRITVGVGRYTGATITVPTAEFPNY